MICLYFLEAYDIKAHLSVSLKPEGEAHYLHIDNFSLDTTPLEGVVYKFKNLFNGNKALGKFDFFFFQTKG